MHHHHHINSASAKRKSELPSHLIQFLPRTIWRLLWGRCDEVQLRGYFNPRLTRRGSLCHFLNGLLPGIFKFFLVESKVTTLADVLRRAQDFTQVIEICVGDDFVWQDAWKRVGDDGDLQSNKRPRKDEEMAG